MTILLVAKIALPFFLAACTLNVIMRLSSRASMRCSLLMLLITDFMALVCLFHGKTIKRLTRANFQGFFFQLKDDGSWLDIGISISNYLICLFTSLVVLILLQIAHAAFSFKNSGTDVFFKSPDDLWKHI